MNLALILGDLALVLSLSATDFLLSLGLVFYETYRLRLGVREIRALETPTRGQTILVVILTLQVGYDYKNYLLHFLMSYCIQFNEYSLMKAHMIIL